MSENAQLMEEVKNLQQLVDQLRNENSKLKISEGNACTLDT